MLAIRLFDQFRLIMEKEREKKTIETIGDKLKRNMQQALIEKTLELGVAQNFSESW